MLCYLYADQLKANKRLAHSMFTDRACQFRDRLNWPVKVDENGWEMDEYDALNPLYVIWQGADGLHKGSMRVLPTTGNCMTNDHFADIAGGSIVSPLIWESTRFCLARTCDAPGRISAAIMLAGCEIGLNFGLKHAIGVFDPRMVRIYRSLGWSPEVMGQHGIGRSAIQVGLWSFSKGVRHQLAARAGLSTVLSALWFRRAFDAQARPVASAVA